MHNGQTADPLNSFSKKIKAISSKRAKTDEDYIEMARIEFLAGLYMGENGPIVPSKVIDAIVIAAAKKMKEGPIAKSGTYADGHAELIYSGPRDADSLWADEKFRIVEPVRVGMAKVVRTRPVFNDWSATVRINYEDTLVNLAQINTWMQIAGTQIGMMDWRPQHGRFTVEAAYG